MTPPGSLHRVAAIALLAILSVTIACVAGGASAGGWVRVIKVIDGDTIVVERGGRDETIRIAGIDAPELSHPESIEQYLAREAKAAVEALLSDRRAILVSDSRAGERDRFQRGLAHVETTRGEDVGLELVEAGLARVLDRYENSRSAAQREASERARAAGRGLWADGGRAEVRWLLAEGRAPLVVHPTSGGRYAVVSLGRIRAGVSGRDLSDALWAARRAQALAERGEQKRAQEVLDEADFSR